LTFLLIYLKLSQQQPPWHQLKAQHQKLQPHQQLHPHPAPQPHKFAAIATDINSKINFSLSLSKINKFLKKEHLKIRLFNPSSICLLIRHFNSSSISGVAK